MKRFLGLLLAAALLTGCAPQGGGLPETPDAPAPTAPGESAQPARQEPDPLVALYLSALRDLYAEDTALNDGAETLFFDLTGENNLTGAQKDDLIARAAAAFGLPAEAGTYDELVERGLVDAENPYLEKGLLFVLTSDADAGGAFPFTLQKWRSALGAYYFANCAASQGADGAWSYTLGEFMAS